MIASLTGTARFVGLDRLVLTVGGVGMLVLTTPATAAGIRVGQELTLETTLIVREDSLTLYGFATAGEKEMFETAQTVTGVGPRLALALLSVLSPTDLAAAVANADLAALTKVPGVGKKGAERLILELRDKLPATTASAPAATPPATVGTDRGQVVEALVGLGWSAKAAGDVVERVANAPDAPADLPGLLRAALRELGR